MVPVEQLDRSSRLLAVRVDEVDPLGLASLRHSGERACREEVRVLTAPELGTGSAGGGVGFLDWLSSSVCVDASLYVSSLSDICVAACDREESLWCRSSVSEQGYVGFWEESRAVSL